MRIAQINQTYFPMISGAAIFVQRLSEGMAARGHSILVVAASERGPAYEVRESNLHQVRVSSLPNPLRVGQRVNLNPRNAVLKALEGFSPEVIHLHDPLQMGAAGLSYCQQFKIPSLLTIHAIPVSVASYAPDLLGLRQGINDVLWLFSRRFSRRLTSVVVPTQAVADLVFSKLHLPPLVISGGVDTQIFHTGPNEPSEEASWRARLGIPPGVPLILHVGRLDADKQVEIVIQAASIAMEESPAHLLVVGDGSKKEGLIWLCQELGIQEKSHFPGYITLADGLPAVYRLGSLFVTATQVETQGLVLLEAAASGLPIVAIRANSIPESVHDGQTGYLVLNPEPRALAESMLQLLKHPELSARMGQAGRELALLHSLDHTLDAYEQLYRSLIIERR